MTSSSSLPLSVWSMGHVRRGAYLSARRIHINFDHDLTKCLHATMQEQGGFPFLVTPSSIPRFFPRPFTRTISHLTDYQGVLRTPLGSVEKIQSA